MTRAIATYGGHIVTVQFATPEGTQARSEIVAKVPIERMQEATDRFTALGRLAGAQVDISDLQERADTLEQRVAAVRLQIARFDAQLAAPDLTKLQKATLVERRARARQRLADLNADVSATKQEAALADLTVILETDDEAIVPAKSGSDAGDRAKDALGLLADIGVIALYAAIVAAPLLLAIALILGGPPAAAPPPRSPPPRDRLTIRRVPRARTVTDRARTATVRTQRAIRAPSARLPCWGQTPKTAFSGQTPGVPAYAKAVKVLATRASWASRRRRRSRRSKRSSSHGRSTASSRSPSMRSCTRAAAASAL